LFVDVLLAAQAKAPRRIVLDLDRLVTPMSIFGHVEWR
jgi:hypothetical protein